MQAPAVTRTQWVHFAQVFNAPIIKDGVRRINDQLQKAQYTVIPKEQALFMQIVEGAGLQLKINGFDDERAVWQAFYEKFSGRNLRQLTPDVVAEELARHALEIARQEEVDMNTLLAEAQAELLQVGSETKKDVLIELDGIQQWQTNLNSFELLLRKAEEAFKKAREELNVASSAPGHDQQGTEAYGACERAHTKFQTAQEVVRNLSAHYQQMEAEFQSAIDTVLASTSEQTATHLASDAKKQQVEASLQQITVEKEAVLQDIQAMESLLEKKAGVGNGPQPKAQRVGVCRCCRVLCETVFIIGAFSAMFFAYMANQTEK